MPRNEPLKAILASTRALWDHDGNRFSVRSNFAKVLVCRTEALGSEVYASSTEQKIVHHTCKSRACPSCGFRATRSWQRELWASLPDVRFAGVVFTMPDTLWPIFQRNRHLLADLPALGAGILDEWSKEAYGARLMIMVVRHTFGRHLNFNPHLHILVSNGGLQIRDGRWVSGFLFDKATLMKRWRYALITYLREAQKRRLIQSLATASEIKTLLTSQYERWWNIDVQPFSSKTHFIRYVGRYMRRPPLAQYRILQHTGEEITFRTQDHRSRKEVVTRYPMAELVRLLSEQVPDHYKHGIRYFGLLSPRGKNQTSGALFAQLGQILRPKPLRISWSHSIEREFGSNPLKDSTGELMRLISRRPPSTSAPTAHCPCIRF